MLAVNFSFVQQFANLPIGRHRNSIQLFCNSSNGTYINGIKRHGQIKLNPTDIVRIGNTTLPWQNYFHLSTTHNPRTPEPSPVQDPVKSPQGPKSPLGVFALILSLVGIGIVIYSVFLLVNYGFAAFFISSPYKYIISGIGISILSYILACVADYQNEKDNDDYDGDINISIAKWLCSITILVVVGFYIYIKLNSQALNPFN